MTYEVIDTLTEVGMRLINHNIAKADGHTSVHTYIMIPRYVKFIHGVVDGLREHIRRNNLELPQCIEPQNVKVFLLDDQANTTVIIQCDSKGEVASVTVQYREI